MAKIQFLLETAVQAKQRIRAMSQVGAKGSAKVSEMQILNRKVFNAVQYSWKKVLNSLIARDGVQREYTTTVHVNYGGGVNVLDGLVIVPLHDASNDVLNESYNPEPLREMDGTLISSPTEVKQEPKVCDNVGTLKNEIEATNADNKII